MQSDDKGAVRQSGAVFYSLLQHGMKLRDVLAFAAASCGSSSHENAAESVPTSVLVPEDTPTRRVPLCALSSRVLDAAAE